MEFYWYLRLDLAGDSVSAISISTGIPVISSTLYARVGLLLAVGVVVGAGPCWSPGPSSSWPSSRTWRLGQLTHKCRHSRPQQQQPSTSLQEFHFTAYRPASTVKCMGRAGDRYSELSNKQSFSESGFCNNFNSRYLFWELWASLLKWSNEKEKVVFLIKMRGWNWQCHFTWPKHFSQLGCFPSPQNCLPQSSE